MQRNLNSGISECRVASASGCGFYCAEPWPHPYLRRASTPSTWGPSRTPGGHLIEDLAPNPFTNLKRRRAAGPRGAYWLPSGCLAAWQDYIVQFRSHDRESIIWADQTAGFPSKISRALTPGHPPVRPRPNCLPPEEVEPVRHHRTTASMLEDRCLHKTNVA